MYFSSIFSEAGSNEAIYNGEKIYSCYFLEPKKQRLKIKYISKKDNGQCIVLAFAPNAEYKINYNEKELLPRKGAFPTIDLLEETFGSEFILDIEFSEGRVGICNGNELNLGNRTIISYQSRGHAMKITKKGNVLNFKCNSDEDGHDFDDLEFEIEFLEVE